MFKVNGFRCEHHVLTVAVNFFVGGVGREGSQRVEVKDLVCFYFCFFSKKRKKKKRGEGRGTFVF